jgi:hypothetical protein
MNPDDPRWRALPVLKELHGQWWAARGGKLGESQRPFSRDWDQLLEDAGLLSADQRREADRDARSLAESGLVELRPVRYRPHLISRILVPLAAEPRLAALFGDPVQSENKGPDLSGVTWAKELSFLRKTRVGIDADDLLLLNEFFARGGQAKPIVPVKERSLQIFGDEKRLDALLFATLFRSDRLTLDLLRCELIGEPLGWRRGPAGAADRPVLVIENAATWHSYCRWNAERGLFSAVVYGKGFQSAACIQYLADIFAEIGGHRQVVYFGDLYPPGLQIPFQASAYAKARGLPPVEPHLWSYRQLLDVGHGQETDWDGEPADQFCADWLGELAEPVRHIFARGKRLAQEHVGWEFLSRIGPGVARNELPWERPNSKGNPQLQGSCTQPPNAAANDESMPFTPRR